MLQRFKNVRRLSAQPRGVGGDPSTLWVSYCDPATLRRRLVDVAQQVRALCDTSAPPDLVLPRDERMRHGFWFMRFEDEARLAAARQILHEAPFATDCGSLRGELQLDAAKKPLQLRAMLNVARVEPDPVTSWLERTFGAHGAVEVSLPRLRNNWDGGMAFVKYAEPDAAEAALERLDGTPSLVTGCNLFVDHAYMRRLVSYRRSADAAPRESTVSNIDRW